MIQISSSSLLIDIEQNFKVTAGPGAGKTYWLTQHIQNILSRSHRLRKLRKIACITYTNIAVETIVNRIGTESIDTVEVSTIHSFLYKHIVKPYVNHIADDYDLDVTKMKGHEDIKPSYSKVRDWLDNHSHKIDFKHPYTSNQLINLSENKDALFNWLSKIKYEFDNNLLSLKGNVQDARQIQKTIGVLEVDLFSYKKLYWKEGKLSHDDVLFFSYELIRKFPFILKVLRSKFPYFFIDEFQDTSPIQAEIISLLAMEETIVGVIGDPAQSIYSFQGASLENFKEFESNNMKKFIIKENRRSSNQIVTVLNSVRFNMSQYSYKKIESSKPILIIGNYIKAHEYIKSDIYQDYTLHTLTRDNITSNNMSFDINNNLNKNLIKIFSKVDSPKRFNIIRNSIESLELSNQGFFKEAIQLMKMNFDDLEEKDQIKNSIVLLQKLLKERSNFLEKSLLNFSEIIREFIQVSKVSRGKVKSFYEESTYQEIAASINFKTKNEYYRTIHRAKGDEFKNVFLVSPSLDFLINSNLSEDEEHRIFYVGMSRAIDNLVISVPEISDIEIDYLKDMFNIIHFD